MITNDFLVVFVQVVLGLRVSCLTASDCEKVVYVGVFEHLAVCMFSLQPFAIAVRASGATTARLLKDSLVLVQGWNACTPLHLTKLRVAGTFSFWGDKARS